MSYSMLPVCTYIYITKILNNISHFEKSNTCVESLWRDSDIRCYTESFKSNLSCNNKQLLLRKRDIYS